MRLPPRGKRAGAPEGLANRWRKLCGLNAYATTLHVINSAVVKLSKLTMAMPVYRGLHGATLPRAFFDVGTPFIKAAFTLSQFAEASENGGRAKSPWTSLPAWWKARKDLGLNVQR